MVTRTEKFAIILFCASLIAIGIWQLTTLPIKQNENHLSWVELNHYVLDEAIFIITRSGGESGDLLNIWRTPPIPNGYVIYTFEAQITSNWNMTQFHQKCEYHKWEIVFENATFTRCEKKIFPPY